MSTPESRPPFPEGEIPSDELAPDVEHLISNFRETFPRLPEFQEALCEIYFNPFGYQNEGVVFSIEERIYQVKYESNRYSGNFRQTERLDVMMSEDRGANNKRIVLELKKKSKGTSLGAVDYAVTDDEGNMNWEENHNKKSALKGARDILEELRNPQGEASVQVSDSASDTPSQD